MAAPAMIAAAAGMQAAGSLMGGISQQRQAEFQARQSELNARQAQRRATVQRSRLDRQQRRRMGRARAVAASRGVTLEGSPLEFLSDQAADLAEEQALVQFGADVQSAQDRARAGTFRQAGRESLIGGMIGAGSALAGGMGQAGLIAPGGGSVPPLTQTQRQSVSPQVFRRRAIGSIGGGSGFLNL